jgi:hypothetical protein
MKLRGWIVTLLIACASAPLVIAQSGPVMSADESYVPRLGDLMNAIQSRHLKLYFAGKAQNWPLADYELRQLKASLSEAAMLYSGIPVSNVTTLAISVELVDSAIAAKDGRKFAKTFGDLTGGCNSCHQSMERAFIAIRVPTEQPFSNQVFAPQGKP